MDPTLKTEKKLPAKSSSQTIRKVVSSHSFKTRSQTGSLPVPTTSTRAVNDGGEYEIRAIRYLESHSTELEAYFRVYWTGFGTGTNDILPRSQLPNSEEMILWMTHAIATGELVHIVGKKKQVKSLAPAAVKAQNPNLFGVTELKNEYFCEIIIYCRQF